MGSFGRDRGGSRGGGRDFGGRGGGFGGGRDRGFGGGRNFGGRDSGPREMFSATCSNCGKECQVPFKPTNGKPVYCSECFEKMNGGRETSRRPERTDFRSPAPAYDQTKILLDGINVKLDKILAILAPAPVVKEDKVVKEEKVVEEVKPEKTKKVTKKVASEKKE
jgi:CxxC-x17-CxxC domain-containing protein